MAAWETGRRALAGPGTVHLADATEARAHRLLAGKLDRQGLGFAERAIMHAVHAPEGDFRDWEAIRAWASDIGATLSATV